MDDVDESLLFNLVYCSKASAAIRSSDINEIVSVAKRNNSRTRVTGWLVYSSGIFFQWLEGDRDQIKLLMAAIAEDPRHHSVVVLSEAEEVRERLFSDWDMELVSAQDIRTVLADAMDAATDVKTTRALRRLIQELNLREAASR